MNYGSLDAIMPSRRTATRIVAVLWFLWSLLHIAPGVFGMINALLGDISSMQFLFPDTDPDGMASNYPKEVYAILVTFGQHGFNLFWFGLVTLICSIRIWARQDSSTELLLAAIVGGLADVGALFAVYMIGRIDIVGLLIFAGTLVAILLSSWIPYASEGNPSGNTPKRLGGQ